MSASLLHMRPLDNTACFTALRAHDARFDGLFFVGVSSTGIYCRPVCRAKPVKEDNCRFFSSAAAAEAAGFRPCLKCRPELAPGFKPADTNEHVARKAVLMMQENCLTEVKVSKLAEQLNVTDRRLRYDFSRDYGVSPAQYLLTLKLHLAKRLLTDTQLSMAEVAKIAGFGTANRLDAHIQKRYRLAPLRLNKAGRKENCDDGGITLPLAYRPPYAWNELLDFLGKRAVPGIESVAGSSYRRTVTISKGEAVFQGWISVTHVPEKNLLSVTMAPALIPVVSQVLLRVRRLFDLDSDPQEVYEKLKIMNELSPDACKPGIRVPGCFDPFEITVRAILGQQVTIKAARTLTARLAAAFGEKIDTPFKELNTLFPVPDIIHKLTLPIEDHLGPLGITGIRARSIGAVAEALMTASLSFSPSADPFKEMQKLEKIPGLGPWTVQYIGMRAFGWPDAFLHTDHGVKAAFPGFKSQEILRLSQAWKPWRSYATVNLWNSQKGGADDTKL